jgi:hypothetical protein
MVAGQRALETAQDVEMYRAQGAMKQLRIIDLLPREIEYQIWEIEQEDNRQKEATSAR